MNNSKILGDGKKFVEQKYKLDKRANLGMFFYRGILFKYRYLMLEYITLEYFEY